MAEEVETMSELVGLKSSMTNIARTLEYAARSLPEGCEIVLTVERGAASVALMCDGDEIAPEIYAMSSESLAEQVQAAVVYAIDELGPENDDERVD